MLIYIAIDLLIVECNAHFNIVSELYVTQLVSVNLTPSVYCYSFVAFLVLTSQLAYRENINHTCFSLNPDVINRIILLKLSEQN